MILGLVGNQLYENRLDIKKLIWNLKNNVNDIKIVTISTNYNIQKYAKKYCIEFGVDYGECTPYHMNWNNYTIEDSYLYNKPYSPKWFFVNNKKFIEYCDYFIFFGEISTKEDINLIKKIKKTEKYIKNIR